jgi:hypothetical protein
MKKLVTAVALCAALGGLAALPAHAQSDKAMQTVKSMKTDKDGMITKAEFMRMVEEKWNAMDLLTKNRLTQAEAAKLLDWLAAGGTAP